MEEQILSTYFSLLRRALVDTAIDVDALETEWRDLYPVAWADFQRFLSGGVLGIENSISYSDAVTTRVVNAMNDELLMLAQQASMSAGVYIQSQRNRPIASVSKGFESAAMDIVTEIDRRAQTIVLETLAASIARYDLGVLAEEEEHGDSRLNKHAFWAIDPLDGTQRFVDGLSGYAVSIALVTQSGEALLGVVYDPVGERMFHAVKGRGFYLNGTVVSKPTQAKSQDMQWYADQSLKTHVHYARYKTQFDIRFVGGAVMNIINLLIGGNGCYCKSPKPTLGGCAIWDLAAVSLMVTEHGGSIRDYNGAPLNLNRKKSLYYNDVGLVVVSSDLRHDTVLARIRQAELIDKSE